MKVVGAGQDHSWMSLTGALIGDLRGPRRLRRTGG